MLIEIDYTGKTKTRYKCDRCNADLTIENKRAIYVQEPRETAKKKWDLCPSCFAALNKGIKKGKK